MTGVWKIYRINHTRNQTKIQNIVPNVKYSHYIPNSRLNATDIINIGMNIYTNYLNLYVNHIKNVSPISFG